MTTGRWCCAKRPASRAWPGLLLVGLAGACQEPQAGQPAASSELSTEDVLARCAATYERLSTLQARGFMRDYRGKERRVATIGWDFARPDRCRLQIEMDVAVIHAERWWTYDSTTGRYRAHAHFSRTPIETAAYLLSGDMPLLLPAVMSAGGKALGRVGTKTFAGWKMEGVNWHAERPCYVLSRPGWGPYQGGRLRLWIDQDTYLIRGWALLVPGADGGERTVMGCSYYELVADQPLPAERFQLNPPKPILLTPNARPPIGGSLRGG